MFGWRILWLLNLPTGLILVLLGGFIPESAKFLLARGRDAEARDGDGAVRRDRDAARRRRRRCPPERCSHALTGAKLVGKLVALVGRGDRLGADQFRSAAVAARRSGRQGLFDGGVEQAARRIRADRLPDGVRRGAALQPLEHQMVAGHDDRRDAARVWSACCGSNSRGGGSPVLPVALLIVGSNGIIAILLPYAAESFPLRVRGRATGWVAACTKAGGVAAQALSITALVPAMGVAAALIMVPTALALALCAWFGRETRGRDLRLLDEGVAG